MRKGEYAVSDKIRTIKAGGFTAALLGYVEGAFYDDGLAYLRIVGSHNAVRAIWAKLSENFSNRRKRGAQHAWEVKIGGHHVKTGAVKYHSIQTKLPCGQLDLVMLHPSTTVTCTGPSLVFVVDADHQGPPPGWFARLNSALKLPLKEEWASLLWEKGQEAVTATLSRQVNDHYDDSQRKWVMRTEVYEDSHTLINELSSQGSVQGYSVDASESAEPYWLAVIRGILGVDAAEQSETTRFRVGENESELRPIEGQEFAQTATPVETTALDPGGPPRLVAGEVMPARIEFTVTYERDWTWVAFEEKPSEKVRDALRTLGAAWGKRRGAWYFKRHVEVEVIRQVIEKGG